MIAKANHQVLEEPKLLLLNLVKLLPPSNQESLAEG